MLKYFSGRKEKIALFLKEFLEKQKDTLSGVNVFGADICTRLYDFSASGKMLRGGLVCLGYDIFTERTILNDNFASDRDEVIRIGGAVELMQSALLIHDDIMDRDTLRRGAPTIHRQYTDFLMQRGELSGSRNARHNAAVHTGEAMGICAGDIAFFLAFSILASLELKRQVHKRILKLFSREITLVGVAQMEDVFLSQSEKAGTEEAILNLYKYKTGRYTFSMPLVAGALVSGCDEEEAGLLDQLGEKLGVIFQIKDDELGLFGNEDEAGKPIGSDIREGKKTIIYYLLAGSAGRDELKKFKNVYGNPNILDSDLDYVKNLAIALKIPEKINSIINGYVEDIDRKLEQLDATAHLSGTEHYRILKDIIAYNLDRKK